MTSLAKAVVAVIGIALAAVLVFAFRDSIRQTIVDLRASSEEVVEPPAEEQAAQPEQVESGTQASAEQPPPAAELSPGMALKLKLAEDKLSDGDLEKALKLTENILLEESLIPFTKPWREIANLCDQIMSEVIMTDVPFPGKIRYVVKSGDSLAVIAKKHNTTVALLQMSNRLDRTNPTIYPDQVLKIYQGDWRIEVSKSDFTLVLYDDQRIVKVYDIATGRQNRTPVGTFVVDNKETEPTWYAGNGKVIKFGTKDNVLGTRWMGIKPTGDTDQTLKGFGIHGTWEPESIGSAASLGCVRMVNDQVEELYDIVTYGTPITIIE